MATGHRTGPSTPHADTPHEERLVLPRDAFEARARVAEALAGATALRGAPPTATALGDALLVTSELFTNAMRHGGGLTGFRVEIDRDAVTVTVEDASHELPHVRRGRTERVSGSAEGGFGWPLIRLLARGIRLSLPPGGGKTIEVRLPLH
ncbi:ATP-binding protein [Streptomyces sp. NPDC057695]|uniref:ATP-binding protein n=1 Tax=unclassified Streptomyces TaxID=2593676 RepID=UPI00363545AD